LAGCSDATRGLFGGGRNNPYAYNDVIDYITIATTSNATDFGDLTNGRYELSSCSDGTTGVWAGDDSSPYNAIDYVTISTPANATDFGDLTTGRSWSAACSGN
jgi:hypothetical protein